MTAGPDPHPKTAIPVFGLIASCWLWLTEPAALIREPERRRRARLLSALLVASLGLGLLAFIPTAFNPALKPQKDTLGEEFTLILPETPMEVTWRGAVPGKA